MKVKVTERIKNKQIGAAVETKTVPTPPDSFASVWTTTMWEKWN